MLFLLPLAWCSQLSRATFANHVLKIEPPGKRGWGSQIANGKDATCGSEITCLDFPWGRNQCALSHYSCGGLLSWFILARLRWPFSWDKHSVADRVDTHSLSQHTHTHTHTYALYVYIRIHTHIHTCIFVYVSGPRWLLTLRDVQLPREKASLQSLCRRRGRDLCDVPQCVTIHSPNTPCARVSYQTGLWGPSSVRAVRARTTLGRYNLVGSPALVLPLRCPPHSSESVI